jgi:Tfp pilus assembly major pilin PilA
MKRQRGVTLTGMIFVAIILVVLLLLGFKIVPVYLEYFAIERQFKAMAMDPKLRGASRSQIANAWAARAAVDNLQAVDPNYIEVTKEADGMVVSAEYSVKVPLFKNVSACFDFKPSSK